PRQKREMENTGTTLKFSVFLAGGFSLIIGIGAGIVGAGGAFLLVPVMITILKVPTRITIATSLGITFMSSIGTTIGKVITGEVLLIPAIIVVIVSIVSAPTGAKVSTHTNVKYLQALLTVIIVITAIKIWLEIL